MTSGALFITFEGGDGAGKSTQVALLKQWFEAQGREVVATREPGGTELGREIRKLLLHGDYVSPRAEALLYAADRAHHIDTLVRPALSRGAVVLGDRYLDSSVAYQGAARALPQAEIRQLSLWAVQGLVPDLTIVLDVPVRAGEERVGEQRDRLESAGVSFHQRVRDEFLALAAADTQRFRVVDGTQSIEDVHRAVLVVVEDFLARRAEV